MPNWIEIDARTHELLEAGRYQDAEALLLNAYDELKSKSQTEDLDYLIGLMAHFYSMPEVEDSAKAEHYFLEREQLKPGSYSKLQTANFYIYVTKEFSKAVDKVNEIAELPDSRSSPPYYSGLGLKGQALIALGEIEEAGGVLKELQRMIRSCHPQLPYGDEINFLELADSNSKLRAQSRAIVQEILPSLKTEEYKKRAQQLLEE